MVKPARVKLQCYLGSLMMLWFKPGQWSPTAMASGAPAAKQMCRTFYKRPVPFDCFGEHRVPCPSLFIVILPLKNARHE